MFKHQGIRFLLLVIGLALLIAPAASAQGLNVNPGDCAAGSSPGGPDFVFNGTFAIGAGPGPGVAPAAGFTIGGNIYNAGDGNYPPDTSIAIQTGSISYFGGIAQQDPFPGDPAYGIPGVNTYLYVNGNNTGGPYIFWQQTISGLAENTTYNIYSYMNNIVVPGTNAMFPTPEFLIDGIPTALPQPIPEDPDEWVRFQITFTTAPGQTSITLALRDNTMSINGDDLAVTYVAMQECVPDAPQNPAISVQKSVNPTQANPGDTVTYTYIVTNTGDVTLNPVTLTDDQLGTITLPVTSLTPGQNTSVNVDYTIQLGDLPLTNIATASGTPPTGSAVSSNASATVTEVGVVPPAPGIAVTKTVNPRRASPGDTVTYTYVVTNTGNVTLDPVTLNDDRLGPITLPVTSLAPGQSVTVTVDYTIQPGDLPLTNVATVGGVPPAGGAVNASASATVRPPGDPTPDDPPAGVAAAPALQIVDPFITKSVNPPFAVPGESVTWTITISNPGSIAVNNVQMQDTMPAEVAIQNVSATAGSASFSGQAVNFSIGTLNPGASVTITINTRVRDDAALPFVITNRACTTSSENPDARCAQATLVSAGQLPATGESPWSPWRMPVFALAALLLGGGVISAWRLAARKL